MMLRFLTAGESHGPYLTAILDGMPAGLALSAEDIERDLARRQHGYGSGGRMKIERDQAEIASGVMAGRTTGGPISMRIVNRDFEKWRDRDIEPMTVPRPGHADLTGAIKYGYRELRLALERASARETAARVAVGAACRKLLATFGIIVGSYVVSIGDVDAPPPEGMDYLERFTQAAANDVHVANPDRVTAVQERIRRAMEERDTLGGVIEVVALNVPPGLGSHVQWDRRLDARLAGALMSVHAMKGVEIGPAFENARRPGTLVHDEIFVEDGRLVRRTNRAGGFEGGITTGEPIVARVAMKPIATTLTPLRSVDLASGEPSQTRYERSDFCAVPRAGVILEAMTCFVLADALLEKLGGDSIEEMRPRFEKLRQARLEDLLMDNQPWRFGYEL
ncbi:MAG: chorismate synthase [Anaerolineae bacterium]